MKMNKPIAIICILIFVAICVLLLLDRQFALGSLSYNQVRSSKSEMSKTEKVYNSRYDGREIKWQGKISNYYTQISGIKFCIVDGDHQNVDVNKPCDWFWTTSKEIENANDISINPNWNGQWVNYALNHYNAVTIKDLKGGVYTVSGTVNGIDCGVDDKCIPNIEIINISTTN